MSEIIREVLRTAGDSGPIPKLDELREAIEHPDKADAAVLAYLGDRPELARLLRNLGKDPLPEGIKDWIP